MSIATCFLLLVGLQAAHSVEEFSFGLYELLPYFRPFGSAAGAVFATLNAGFVTLGLWCYRTRVLPGAASAAAWAWGWCAIELANGVLHPGWTLLAGRYIPGTATAPFLLVTALYLMSRLVAEGRAARPV